MRAPTTLADRKETGTPRARAADPAVPSFWAFLEHSPFFAKLEPEARRDLVARMRCRFYARDTYIASQGDAGDELFIVRQGKVKLMRCTEPDRLFVVALLGPGDLFGLAAAVDGFRRAFTSMALEDTHLLALHRNDLLLHVRRFPETAILLMREMSHRMRLQAETMENLALKNVSVRVVRTLVHLNGRTALMDDSGLIIRNPPTQQDLACMVGARRETVSRVMTGFFRDGLAERRGRTVVLTFALLSSCGLSRTFRPSRMDAGNGHPATNERQPTANGGMLAVA